MALDFKAGSFAASTSTGNQSVTVGFAPKAVIFLSTYHVADGDQSGWGGVSAIGSAVIRDTDPSEFNLDFASGLVRHDESYCTGLESWNGTHIRDANLVSFDTDGFTINWNTVSAAAEIVLYMAFGGDDLTDYEIIRGQAGSATGIQEYATAFVPDSLFFFTVGHDAAPPAETAQDVWTNVSFGFTSNTTTSDTDGTQIDRACVGFAVQDSLSTTAYRRSSNRHVLQAPDTDASVRYEADIDSFQATDGGFTLDWETVTGDQEYFWALALKGPQFKVVDETQRIGTTGTKATTGVGFQPRGMFTLNWGIFESALAGAELGVDFGSADDQFNTDDGRWSYTKLNDDGGVNYDGDSLDRSLSIRNLSFSGVWTTLSEGDIQSFDSDGYTLDWVTVGDSSQRWYHAMLFGDADATPTTSVSSSASSSLSTTQSSSLSTTASSSGSTSVSSTASSSLSSTASTTIATSLSTTASSSLSTTQSSTASSSLSTTQSTSGSSSLSSTASSSLTTTLPYFLIEEDGGDFDLQFAVFYDHPALLDDIEEPILGQYGPPTTSISTSASTSLTTSASSSLSTTQSSTASTSQSTSGSTTGSTSQSSSGSTSLSSSGTTSASSSASSTKTTGSSLSTSGSTSLSSSGSTSGSSSLSSSGSTTASTSASSSLSSSGSTTASTSKSTSQSTSASSSLSTSTISATTPPSIAFNLYVRDMSIDLALKEESYA